jgi:hypothetical protein
VVAGVLGAGALAAEPVLHEYFDFDGASVPKGPSEFEESLANDNTTGATNAEAAASPAAPRSSGEAGPHASADPEKYELDGNTSRPDSVGYSDPFVPSIPPFKRLHAYDSVNDALELVVSDKSLRSLSLTSKVKLSDDQFLGVMDINLSGEPVRIPSVGPMTRVAMARLDSSAPFQLLVDSAENWFLQTDARGVARLTVHLAIDRRVFGSAFADVGWSTLAQHLPALPAHLDEHAEPVLSRLELTQAVSPAEAVQRLVAYFRDFAPSDQRTTLSGPELYESIALGQRGVCRHRSFAFVITAFALGLPNRFVHNEAHAWVEVYDGDIWHRIDLGGAAGDVQLGGQLDVPHIAPQDPFEWPSNSESGQDMVEQAVSQRSGAGGDTARASDDADDQGREAESPEPTTVDPPDEEHVTPLVPSAMPSDEAEALVPTEPEQPESETAPESTSRIVVSAQVKEAVRGSRVAIKGRVQNRGADCSLLRVNVMLRGESGSVKPMGVLVTDAAGRFAGEVVVPASVPVGDYELFVATEGNSSCPGANSRD